jgi:hypothetical protein
VNIIRQAVPAALATVLSAALATGLAACGSGGSSSSTSSPSSGASGASASVGASASAPATASAPVSASSDPLANLTAQQIIAKAEADTEAASSVTLAGSGTDAGKQIQLTLSIAKDKGCVGQIAEQGLGAFQLVYSGSTVWVKPNTAFWKYALGANYTPSTAAAVTGKWVQDKASDTSGLGSIVQFCSVSDILKQSIPAGHHLAKNSLTTLNGTPAWSIQDITSPATMYVTDIASPVFLRATTNGSSGGTFTFSNYGAAVALTPPPASEIVNGSQYGL